MNNLFHTGALDEWGNEYCIKCDHHSYNRDCNYCKDVYEYINYGAKEGYGECEDMGLTLDLGSEQEQKEAWEKMKSYYNEYSDYEPEYDPEPNEELGNNGEKLDKREALTDEETGTIAGYRNK